MKRRIPIINILFKSFLGAVNFVIIILMVASAYSDGVTPLKSTIAAYLGLIFPFFVVLNLSFLLYWIIVRDLKFVIVCAISFLICYPSIKLCFPFHSKKDVPEGAIKVLTYNVMGFDMKDHTKDKPNPIVAYIQNTDADIVCMQEFTTVEDNAKLISKKKIDTALSGYKYKSVIPLSKSGKLTTGIAVYSKYPIKDSQKVEYDSNFNGSSIHTLDVNGKKVALVNNHLESFKLTAEDRDTYSSFLKNINSSTFEEFKESAGKKLGPAYKIRAKQAYKIAQEISKIDADYIIVCGDFNDTPVSYVHRKVQGDLKDAYAESGKGYGISYNQNYFWFRIDNILYSPTMKSYNCTIDKVDYSDHYPMWCYLEMK